VLNYKAAGKIVEVNIDQIPTTISKRWFFSNNHYWQIAPENL
jgi:hypothetical protein